MSDTATDYCKSGDVVEIGGVMRLRVEGRYDYAADRCRCHCGGLGIPWAGWFNCDSGCIALVETGERFVCVP